MWMQIINAVLGIWLMISPAVLQGGVKAEDNNHITGPVIATFAIIALWEATHNIRLWNVPLGVWLVVAPFILGYETGASIINSILTGILIVVISLKKGTIKGKYAGGWKVLWKDK